MTLEFPKMTTIRHRAFALSLTFLALAADLGCAEPATDGGGAVRLDAGKGDGVVPDAMVLTPDAKSMDSTEASCGVCIPNAQQTESCRCGTAERTRSCTTDCTWSQWGACTGGIEYPHDPGDVTASVCPPYDRPAVFFAPHPDDESLGMGGAIAEHVASGRSVFIELMTHGEGSGARALLGNGQSDAWHNGSHDYALTTNEFGDARVREFRAAASALGVRGIFVSDFGDGNLTIAEVGSRVSFWTGRADAGLSLKGTAGIQDPRSNGGAPHPDHAAVWNGLTATSFGDIRGYLVYHHEVGAGTFTRGAAIDSASCVVKRQALNAYKVWDPDSGRYAVGYHSTGSLFDAVAATCTEYLVVP